MKACFIKLDSFEETKDGTVTINASNISSLKRMVYNDKLQTLVLMTGGERFGVKQTPQDIIELVEQENEKSPVYN